MAAGPGEALLPITSSIPKAMVPILGKPLIEYQIEKLAALKINEIIIVVGPMGNQIRSYLENGSRFGVEINYLEQPKDKNGIDEAIKLLKPLLEHEDLFVLQHTDIISDPSLITRTLNSLDNLGADMAIAVCLQSDIAEFGVVNIDPQGYLEHVYEEGSKVKGNYVIGGTFVLTPKIFSYLDQGYHFNDAFNQFIKDGGKIACGVWTDSWVDVGQPWDIIKATRLVIEDLTYTRIHPKAKVEGNTQILGPVIIEEGATVSHGSVIKGPAYIGKNVFIGNNVLIRSNAVIDDNCVIGMGSEIKGSVLMKDATVSRLSYIGDSVVCQNASIHAGCVTINKSKNGSITSVVQNQRVIVPLQKFGAVFGPNSTVWPNVTLMPGTIIEANTEVLPNQVVSGRIA